MVQLISIVLGATVGSLQKGTKSPAIIGNFLRANAGVKLNFDELTHITVIKINIVPLYGILPGLHLMNIFACFEP
ncbi:MAG: hypothetical protein QM791_01000 [Ferruginibacter sp.]